MAKGLPDLSTIDISPRLEPGAKLITAYSSESVTVNDTKFTDNIILTSTQAAELLKTSQITEIIPNLHDPIIILGSDHDIQKGKFKEFMHKNLAQIPCEIMTYSAACRTFNILVQESRNIILILLINEDDVF